MLNYSFRIVVLAAVVILVSGKLTNLHLSLGTSQIKFTVYLI
jgi:hypothetical protein